MLIKSIRISLCCLMLASCCEGGAEEVDEVVGYLSDPRGQCSDQGNSAQHRCQTSFSELFIGLVDNKYIDVVAFSPGGGVGLVFLDRDRSRYEDYSSSLVVYGDIPKESGYILLSGMFRYDRSDLGVGHPWGRQVGSIELTRPGVFLKSVEDRVEECLDLGCEVRYLDGSGVR